MTSSVVQGSTAVRAQCVIYIHGRNIRPVQRQQRRQYSLGELLASKLRSCWILRRLTGHNVVSVQIRKIELEELVFVVPMRLTFSVLLPLCWCWWRVGNLGNEIGCRRLCNAIDEDTKQGDPKKDEKPNSEAKQYSLAVTEPDSLLLWRVFDA